MPPVDDKKRKFLKHLGILAIGGALGMGITKATVKTTDDVVFSLSDKRIAKNEKLIWKSVEDYKDPRNLEDYQAYLLKTNDGKNLPVEKTGTPVINEVVCAYHLKIPDDDGEEKEYENVYCTAPCKRICPVDAIRIKDNPQTDVKKVPTFRGKKTEITDAAGSKCIGCSKCFRVCGYNAIHWINHSGGE